MKKCSKCGELKTKNKFHKDKYRKDGLRIYCKKCRNINNKENKSSVSKDISKDRVAYFYGLFAGDGAFFNHGRTRKLAFYCDRKIPKVVENVKNLLIKFYNKDKVKVQDRKDRGLNVVYVFDKYANKYFNLSMGKKSEDNFNIPKWITEKNSYAKNCLKGLVETDGHIRKVTRNNREYYTCSFTNTNINIFNRFMELGEVCNYEFNKQDGKRENKDRCALTKTDQVVKLVEELSLHHKLKSYNY